MAIINGVSDDTTDRLKSLAKPIDDTWETLLARIGLFVAGREAEFRAFEPEQNGAAPMAASNTLLQGLEAKHLARMSPAMRDMYEALRSSIAGFGDDVEIGVTQSYIRCSVNGRNFAEIAPRAGGLAIYMRPEGLEVEKGKSAELDNVTVERPEKANWTLNALVRVTPTTDLEGLQSVLRRVYTAIKNLRG